MAENGKSMLISTKWLGAAILTFVIGFSILGYLAYMVYEESPPIPTEIASEDGQVLFTGADIMGGQHIFQKYGLMQYGTIFGHGAYLGPDFTAQYLHRAGLLMVIGTLHHLYFSGTSSMFMAFGAFFSAMEVIPLLLLTLEAYRFMRLGAPTDAAKGSVLQVSTAEFPHKWAVMFLVAVGFWNFLGAGVFGFLINLPIVSYYEIGTQLTANHAHGAMMGVYGMLAVAFLTFVARYFIPPHRGGRAMALSFWSLNIGLLLMLFINLLPIGMLQLYDAVANGYWHAREPEFFQSGLVPLFEWLRIIGDTIFIVGGIFPVVYLAILMFLYRNRGEKPTDGVAETFTA